MFGACCSGQQVQLAQQVDALKYVITFGLLSQSISHVSIFMLPNIEFDPGYTLLIYFQINQTGQPLQPEFKLLGGLSLNKQSAIYKIKNNKLNGGSNDGGMMIDDIDMDTETGETTQEVIIGISIEPNLQAEALLLSLKAQQSLLLATPRQLLLTNSSSSSIGIDQKIKISNKVIENCYNFLSSFEDSNKKVPIAKFNEWWKRYIQKLENNPKLLDDD